MRFRITIEYSGKQYRGWQRQKNGLTVQEVLENALLKLLGTRTTVVGSGRTDTGVHAAGQVAHFDAQTTIPADKMVYALNALLPEDIKLIACARVHDTFHAQYDAIRKTYRYQCYLSRLPSPLKNDFYTQIVPPIDLDKVRRAAAKLVGEHDFKAFCSTGVQKKTTVREIYMLKVLQDKDLLAFEIEGNGFLYNMVRIIVGTLVEIGRGKLDECVIDQMLSTGKRQLGGKTYPAKGLCLLRVNYQETREFQA